MSQTNNHAMLESVTTPRSVLRSSGWRRPGRRWLRALVEQLARAMREPGITEESLRRQEQFQTRALAILRRSRSPS